MQLSFLFVILASAYCASALECYKGNRGDVFVTTCPPIKNVCSTTYTTNEKQQFLNTRTCASNVECEKWKKDAIDKQYPYKIYCCNTDKCNDKEIATE